MSEPKNLFNEWYQKFEPSIEKKLVKYKKQYLHFDDKIKIIKPPKNQPNKTEILKHREIYRKIFDDFVSNKDEVSHWQFLPFIKQDLPKYKYKKGGDGKRKKDGSKKRPIMYCCHKDRLLYSYYSILLENEYEKMIGGSLQDAVLAYRRISKTNEKGKSNLDFARESFEKILELKKSDDIVALAFDIEGFFDNLNHEQLKTGWNKVLNTEKLPVDHYKIYKSLTKFSFFNREELLRKILKLSKPRLKYKEGKKDTLDRWVIPRGRFRQQTRKGKFQLHKDDGQVFNNNTYINFREILRISKEKDKILEENKKQGYSQKEKYIFETRTKSKIGIPQGSPMSGLLSNIYMLDFDLAMSNFLSKYNGVYYRYSDDILVLIKKEFAVMVEEFIYNQISKLKLEIKKEKTKRVLFLKNNETSLEVDASANITKNKIGEQKHLKLQYLGLEFDGKKIFIRSSSICKSMNKARYKIKKYYTKTKIHTGNKIFTKKLVYKLTHLGKMNFYRYAVKKNSDPNKIFNKNVYKTFKKQLKKHQQIIRDKIFTPT